MSFNWSEYLQLAQELVQTASRTPHQEARLRCAISRAYYAAFCSARNHLRDRENHTIPLTGQAHMYVINAFRRSLDPARVRLGLDLDRLRIDRGRADYRDAVPGLPSLAQADMLLANQVLSALTTL